MTAQFGWFKSHKGNSLRSRIVYWRLVAKMNIVHSSTNYERLVDRR